MSRDALPDGPWSITESGFDPDLANTYETLFTVGNGRMGTRGALEEGHDSARSGVFIAGIYDGHDAIVTDLVNAPDWVDTAVLVDGRRLDVDSWEVLEHERTLDISQGVLTRTTTFCDEAGRRIRLHSLRTSCQQNRDVSLLQLQVTALDHAARIQISTGLNADRDNLEALPVYPEGRTFTPEQRWAKWARSLHLEPVLTAATDGLLKLQTRTIGAQVDLAYVATTDFTPQPAQSEVRRSRRTVTRDAWFEVPQGESVQLAKIVAVATSRDPGQDGEWDPLARAAGAALQAEAQGCDTLLKANRAAWADLWDKCDAEIIGDENLSLAIRFGIYHLLIAANPDDPTVNIGAKSLTGEGYRGHVFWDTEAIMLPFYLLTQPATARALLGYRHHTLPGARHNAIESGHGGARFAWESADTGVEECPRFTPDGSFRFWSRDEEVHVSADVAYGIGRYLDATGDESFLTEAGAEILFESSRFWMDFAEPDEDGTYHLLSVMGPDEFHSHVDDNAFTNYLAAWHLRYAAAVYEQLSADGTLEPIAARLELQPEEVGGWRWLADRLQSPVVSEEGVIEQFRGYFDRLYVPVTVWDENDMPCYPEGYHHFNCEDTQLLKQPDVLQLMLMLPELFSEEQKRANFEYYEPRTLHKSSLSPAVHAVMGLEVGDRQRAVQYFTRSAMVDLSDNQGNTRDGMHIASAAGTWATLVTGFGGLRTGGDRLSFDPWLPPEWSGLRFRFGWRGFHLRVTIERRTMTIVTQGPVGATLTILVQGEEVVLHDGETLTIPLRDIGA